MITEIGTLTSRHQRQDAVLGEQPAGDQADGQAPARYGPIDPEGPGPLLGLGEGHVDQRERGWGHKGGESALQGSGHEKHRGVRRQASEGRRGGKAQQPHQENPLSPHVVSQAAPEQEQAPEGDGVGGDDPLAVGGADVQSLLGGRQGDVDDGGVDHDHQLRQGQHHQDPLAATGSGTDVGPRCTSSRCGHDWTSSFSGVQGVVRSGAMA